LEITVRNKVLNENSPAGTFFSTIISRDTRETIFQYKLLQKRLVVEKMCNKNGFLLAPMGITVKNDVPTRIFYHQNIFFIWESHF
jgi:hypothetical protein